ncbi:MAG TPA: lipid A deacylase LpxR family protein [Gemmatimonadaceae bacterium]|nr:lipid A deacylase LpxR family protein [Gemmatimonadaceae bacterium]
MAVIPSEGSKRPRRGIAIVLTEGLGRAGVRQVVVALAVGAMTVLPAAAQVPSPGQPPAPRSRLQPPWRIAVRADNDAFNFWRGITQRPDKEYTNGDEVTFELSAAPWWGRRLAKRRAPCTGLELDTARCLTTAFSFGQDMYTPRPSREPRVVPDWREDRPYAAWLYASGEARVLSERALRTVGLQVGVTGAAAFGEFAQRTAHKLTGVYSHDPVGWDTQIGFEPGVILSARDTRRFAARSGRGNVIADFMPHMGASLGNVLTEAETGFRTRVGMNLSNPWWTSGWRTRTDFEMYLLGGARAEAVARNITLDGNTLGAERRVDRTPLVGEYTLGAGARFHGLVAEWRAVTRSREYRTGPDSHAYSTLFAGYEMPARGR